MYRQIGSNRLPVYFFLSDCPITFLSKAENVNIIIAHILCIVI